jgi:hypothetical protein
MAAHRKAITIAADLREIRSRLEEIDEQAQPLKELESQLREEMLLALRRERLATLKTDDGFSYVRAFRSSLGITDLPAALKWASSHDALKVDTARAAKLLKGAGALPNGFEQQETEYLTIKGIKDE